MGALICPVQYNIVTYTVGATYRNRNPSLLVWGQQCLYVASTSATPRLFSPLFFSVSAAVNIDSALGRLDCKCWGPVGPAPKISTFTRDRSMASALATALCLARVDPKPAITAWTLMEALQREALHYSDKPRDSQGTQLSRAGQQPWRRLSSGRSYNTNYTFHERLSSRIRMCSWADTLSCQC